MRKIAIIGCPGSGKSTLARELHAITGLPLYHLDNIWHKPDRTTIPKPEFDQIVSEIMNRDEWIIDGNYKRTIERRILAADTIILLDYPVEVCLEGAKARVGHKRPDLPWFEESLDPDFEQFIFEFGDLQLPRIYEILNKYVDDRDVYIFKSREECTKFVKSLGK